METTEIVFPTTPPPEVVVKVKLPPPPKVPPPPVQQVVKLEPPKINMPKVEPKPEVKMPVMQEKAALPTTPAARPSIVLAPQPKAALAAAAAPALTPQAQPKVEQVHLGDLNGLKPNPNSTRAVAAATLGNPYGGLQGAAKAPQGVVGSTGLGNGLASGSNSGTMGKVASAGVLGGQGTANSGGAYGGGNAKVAAAAIPAMTAESNTPKAAVVETPKTTPPVLISHSQPQYTSEARQLKIEGEVVLRVTITSSGEMVVKNVVRGLGHGLDESAMRSAPTYKFQPAMQNGKPVDYTTNITIRFQTA